MKNLFVCSAKILFACMMLLVVGCGKYAAVERDVPTVDVERVMMPLYELPSLKESEFGNKVYVECSASGVECSSLPSGVTAEQDGAMLLLRSTIPGVEYVVSGSTANAALSIISDFSPLVTLKGLSLTACGENALQVSSKEMIYVRSAGNSAIADVADTVRADSQSAVLKLMGRSMLCGGSLSVSAGRRSAIFCTDTLYISDMKLMLSGAPNHALLSNKSIIFSGGVLCALSDKDIIRCKSGDFVMLGGEVMLSSQNDKVDGVQATNIYVLGGELNVSLAGAASDGLKAKGNIGIRGGYVCVSANGGALFNEKKSDYSSASCLKSNAVIDISGGVCMFSASGDGGKGISCDSVVLVRGGSLRVVTTGGDAVHPYDINAHASSKGIKSDGDIYMLGGNIEVAVLGEGERSEGVEAKKRMYIGGDAVLYVYAYDDGLNSPEISVAGGRTYIYSVANDAVDSNGSIVISGGTLVADGSFIPEQGIDVDDFSAFTMSGGTVLSVGGSMGPYPSLPMNEKSSLPVVVWSGLKAAKGNYVALANEDGKVLFAYDVPRDIEDGTLLVASDRIDIDKEYSFSLSGGVEGAEYLGNGLYRVGEVAAVINSVSFKTKGLMYAVSGDGAVTVVEPGSSSPFGMMPPPFNPGDSLMERGGFPPPPPGGFNPGMMPPSFPKPGEMGNGDFGFPPPPPMRKIKSEYGLGNLPNNDNQ